MSNLIQWMRINVWKIDANEYSKFTPLAAICTLGCLSYSILRDMRTLLNTKDGDPQIGDFQKVFYVLPLTFLFMLIFTKLDLNNSKSKVFTIFAFLFLVAQGLALILLGVKNFVECESGWAESVANNKFAKIFLQTIESWTATYFALMSELYSSVFLNLCVWAYANNVCSKQEAIRFYPVINILSSLTSMLSGVMQVLLGYFPIKDSKAKETPSLIMLSVVIVVNALLLFIFKRSEQLMSSSSSKTSKTTKTTTATDLPEKKQDFTVLPENGSNDEVLEDVDTFVPLRKKKPKLTLKQSLVFLFKSPYIFYIMMMVASYGLVQGFFETTYRKNMIIYAKTEDVPKEVIKGFETMVMSLVTLICLIAIGNRGITLFGWTKTAIVSPIVILIFGMAYLITNYANFDVMHATYGKEKQYDKITLSEKSTNFLVFIFGSICVNLTRALKYSFFDPTKEFAFFILDAEERARAKAAVDLIGSRIGKSGSSLIFLILVACWKNDIYYMIVLGSLFVFIVPAWIYCTLAAGRIYNEKTKLLKAKELDDSIKATSVVIIDDPEESRNSSQFNLGPLQQETKQKPMSGSSSASLAKAQSLQHNLNANGDTSITRNNQNTSYRSTTSLNNYGSVDQLSSSFVPRSVDGFRNIFQQTGKDTLHGNFIPLKMDAERQSSTGNYKAMSASQSSLLDFYSNQQSNLGKTASIPSVTPQAAVSRFSSQQTPQSRDAQNKDEIISNLNKSLSELRFEYDYMNLKCKKLESELEAEKRQVKQLSEALVKPAGTSSGSDVGFLSAKIKDLEISLEKEESINRQLADHVSELTRTQEALMSAERLGSAFSDQPELLQILQRSLVSKDRLLQNYAGKEDHQRKRLSKLEDSIRHLQELNTHLEEQKNYFELKFRDLDREKSVGSRVKKSPSYDSVSDTEEYTSPGKRRNSSRTLLATIADAAKSKVPTEEKSTQTLKNLFASKAENAPKNGIVSALASESHQQEKTKAQHRIGALEVELSRSVRAVEDMQVRFETLFRQWNATEVSLKKRDADFVKLGSEYEQYRLLASKREESFNLELEKVQSILAEKNNLIQNLESQKRAAEKQLSTDKDGLGVEIGALLKNMEIIHGTVSAYLVNQKQERLALPFQADSSPDKILDTIQAMLHAIFENYRADIESISRSNDNLRTMIDEVKVSFQKQIQEREDSIENLKQAIETMEKELNSSRNEWRKEHEHYENKTAGMDAHHRDLLAQLNSHQEFISTLEKEKLDLQRVIEDNDKKAYRNQEELKRECGLMEFKYQETQQGLDDMVQRYNSINQTLVETNLRLQELRREHEISLSDFELARSQMDSERVEYARIKSQLIKDKEDLQEQVKKARQDAKISEERASSLLSQMNRKATEFVDETTHKLADSYSAEKSNLKKEYENSIEELKARHQKELDDFKAQYDAKESALIKDKEEAIKNKETELLQQKQKEIADLMAKRDSEIKDLIKKHDDQLVADRRQYQEKIESDRKKYNSHLDSERRRMAQQLENEKKNNASNVESINKKHVEVVSTLKEEIDKCNAEVISLKKKLQDASVDRETVDLENKLKVTYQEEEYSIKLGKLKDDLDSTKAALSRKNEELSNSCKELEEVTAKSRHFEQQVDELRIDFENQLSELSGRLEQTTVFYSEQVDNLKDTIKKEREENYKSSLESKGLYEKFVSQTKEEVTQLNEKLALKRAENKALDEKVKALQEEVETYFAKTKNVTESLGQEKKKCTELEQKMQIIMEQHACELSGKAAKIRELEMVIVDLQQDDKGEEAARRDAQFEAMIQVIKDQHDSELQKVGLEIKDRENQIDSLKNQITVEEKKQQELIDVLENEKVKAHEMSGRIENLVKELESRDQRLKTAQQEWSQQFNTLQLEIEKVQQEKLSEESSFKEQLAIKDEELEKRLSNELKKFDSIKKELEQKHIQEQEKTVLKHIDEEDRLTGQIQEQFSEMLQLREILAGKDQSLDSISKELSRVKIELESERATIKDLSTELEQRKAETFKTLSEKEKEYERNQNNLSDLVKKLTKESQKLSMVNDGLESQLTSYKEKQQQLEADLLDAQKSFQDLNESHSESIQKMTEKISTLKERHMAIVSEYETRIKQAEEEAVISNGEWQEQVYAKVDEITELKAAADKEKGVLESNIADLKTQFDEVQKRIVDFTTRETFHLKKIEDLEAGLSTNQKDYAQGLESKRFEHESALAKLKEEYEHRCKDLEDENNKINTEFSKSVDGLMGQNRGLHALKDKLMTEIRDLQDNLTQLEEENSRLKREKEDDREAFISQFEKMKTLFLESKREAEELAQENRKLLIDTDEIEKDSEAYWEGKKNEALNEAEKKYLELEDRLKQSKQKYLDSEKERLSLKENLRSFEAEVAKDGQELKLKIEEMKNAFEGKKKALESQLQVSQGKVLELEGLLDGEKGIRKAEKASFQEIQQKLEASLINMENENKAKVQELTFQYEAKLKELQNERDFVTDFQKSLTSSQSELMRQLTHTKDEYYKLKQESELKIISLESQLQTLTDDFTRTSGLLLQSENKVKELDETLHENEKKISKIQASCKNLKQELSQTKNDSETRLSNTIETLQQESRQMELEKDSIIQRLESQINGLSETLKSISGDNEDAERTINDLRDQLNNERSQAKKEYEAAQVRWKQQQSSILEKYDKQLEVTRQEKTEISEKCQILDIHLKEIEAYYKQMTNEDNERQMQLARSMNKLRRKIESYFTASGSQIPQSPEKKVSDPAKILELLNVITEKWYSLQNENQEKSLAQLKAEMQSIIEKKGKELKETKKYIQVLQTENVASQDKIRELENHVQFLNAEIDSIKAVSHKNMEDLQSSHKDKVERLTVEHDLYLDQLRKDVDEANRKNKKLEDEMSESKKISEASHKSMIAESDRQKNIIENIIQQFKQQQNNITQIRIQEVQHFQAKISDLSMKLELQEVELQKEKEKANTLSQELQKERSTFAHTMEESLKVMRDTNQKQMEEIKHSAESERMENESQKAQIALLEQQQQDNIRQIKALSQQLEQERLHHSHRLQEAIYSLKTQDSSMLEQKIKEIHKYSSALSDYKHKYNNCQKSLAECQAIIEDLQNKLSVANNSENLHSKETIKQVQKESALAKKRAQELALEISTLKTSNEQLKGSISEIASRLRRLSQEEYTLIQGLIRDVDSSVNERKGIRMTIQRLESLFESIPLLETRIQSISDLAHLKQQIVSLDAVDESVQRGLESVLSQNENIVQAIENVSSGNHFHATEGKENMSLNPKLLNLLYNVKNVIPQMSSQNIDGITALNHETNPEKIINLIESQLECISDGYQTLGNERDNLHAKSVAQESALKQIRSQFKALAKKLQESHSKEKALRHEIKKLDRDLDIMQDQAKARDEIIKKEAISIASSTNPISNISVTQSSSQGNDLLIIYKALRTEFLNSIRIIYAVVNTAVQQGYLSMTIQGSLETVLRSLESKEKITGSELVEIVTTLTKSSQSIIMMFHSQLQKK